MNELIPKRCPAIRFVSNIFNTNETLIPIEKCAIIRVDIDIHVVPRFSVKSVGVVPWIISNWDDNNTIQCGVTPAIKMLDSKYAVSP